MPAAAKLINVLGCLMKIQTAGGTAISLTTTSDGLLLSYADRNVGAPFSIDYAFDGHVGVNPGNLGNLPLSQPGGKSFTGALPVRFKGAGAAYSASVKPALADILLRIAGFSGTSVTTSGSESWTYAPASVTAAQETASVALYARGELWPLMDAMADWSYEFSNPGPPTHTFTVKAKANGDVTDVSLPSITYPNNSVDPPNANGVTLVVGSFTTNAVMYSGSFKLGRALEPRVALTSGTGHEGFIGGGYNPELILTVEDTAFVGSPYHTSAGLDPIRLREAATKITVSLQFGSTQYNKWKHTFSNAQLFNVQPSAVGRVACWELTFRPSASTPIALDDMSVLFN